MKLDQILPILVSCDDILTAYVAAHRQDVAHHQDDEFVIYTADCSPCVRQSRGSVDVHLEEAGLVVKQRIRTVPAIRFTPSVISVSPDSSYLIVSGTSSQHDDAPLVGLVDLGSGRAEDPLDDETTAKLCKLQYVSYDEFLERPLLRILQVSWLPHSRTHFALLAADDCWRLYHLARPARPEQTFRLKFKDRRGRLGLTRDRAALPKITSFVFGPAGVGWGYYSVLFLADNGAVLKLCPVAPFGSSCSRTQLQRLINTEGLDGTSKTWLRMAFPTSGEGETQTAPIAQVHPHALAESTPALVGPLNAGMASLATSAGPARYTSISISQYVHSTGDSGVASSSPGIAPAPGVPAPISSYSALVTANQQGQLWTHVMDDLQLLPSWIDTVPTVEHDAHGRLVHVTHDCVLKSLHDVEVVASTTELEDADSDSGRHSSTAAAPLVLLHPVNIQLPGTSGRARPAADWDEEEDGTGPAPAAQLYALTDAVGKFVYVHEQGAWAVHVGWLQRIARMMQGTGAEQGDEGQEELPMPEVQPLLLRSAIISSCVTEHLILGSACIAAEEAGRMHLLRPRTPLEQVPGLQWEGGATSALGAAAGRALPSAGSRTEELSGPEKEVIDVYTRLEPGPPPMELPKAKGPKDLDPSQPEGAKFLNDTIDVLHKRDVQYCHLAHTELQQRAADITRHAAELKAEARKLASAAAEAQRAAAALAERVQHAALVSENLSRRSEVLQELHWAAPRPLTQAEHTLQRQLSTWSSQGDSIRSTLQRLKAQASSSSASRQSRRPPLVERSPNLPADQQRRIREALLAQSEHIAALCKQVEEAEAAVRQRKQGLARDAAMKQVSNPTLEGGDG